MHAPRVADIFQRRTGTNHAEKYEGLIQSKNLIANSWKMNALDDSAITDRCTLYEDSANLLKDERFTKTEYQTLAGLSSNPIKAFNGTCVQITSITFPVIWSSELISVTREWRYCGLIYKFSLINNIELKCSFVRCRKYHKSWSNGAAELHI